MSGVFAASLQGAAVWKSRVPQKWFNPNYPVSVSASAPSPLLSCPHAAIFCRWISTYNVSNIFCSGLWNMESASVRNNLFSKHAAVILMLILHYKSEPREPRECGVWILSWNIVGSCVTCSGPSQCCSAMARCHGDCSSFPVLTANVQLLFTALLQIYSCVTPYLLWPWFTL